MKKVASYIYKNFTILWVLVTVVLLLLSTYVNWYLNIHHTYKSIANSAKHISNSVDGLIEDLLENAYTLPVYGKKFPDCQSSLVTDLDRIVINNPNITGLEINDNQHKLICSTLPEIEPIEYNESRARMLFGPYKLKLFDQPVYVIQQRLGNYFIKVLILSSVLESALKSRTDISNSVILYNRSEHKIIMHIDRNTHKPGWSAIEDTGKSLHLIDGRLFASEKLQSISGLMVIALEDHKTALTRILFNQLLVTLAVLGFTILLYFILKDAFTKHYSLRTAMKLALKNKEFYPVYQPIFNNQKEAFTGAEVLLRWRDNLDELIMPDFFIPEAETSGLIIPITLQIVETVFKESKALLRENPGFHLSFNVSALHFKHNSFFDDFYKLVELFHISPSQIVLEITERDLLNKNDSFLLTRMHELRRANYSLAVDDFGTGHASISYLHHFPFNYLKIDKLFIHAIGTKALTESLNSTIIQMAKNLQLIIVAEGVETEEQLRYLKLNEVELIQGWYFSKALPIDRLLEFMQL